MKKKTKLRGSTASTGTIKAAITKNNATAQSLIDNATKVAFRRALSTAQPDEAARLEAIRKDEIDPWYSLVNIAQAKVSAQMLNPGEAVEVGNRETLLRVRYDEEFVDVVMADQEGNPLGTLFAMDNSDVYISDLDYENHHLLLVTVPEYEVLEIYAFDPGYGVYVYVAYEPMPAVTKAA